MSKKGNSHSKRRYTILHQRSNGRWRKVSGLVYSSRQSARLAVGRILTSQSLLGRTDLNFKAGVLR
jgi:hypothetical protein